MNFYFLLMPGHPQSGKARLGGRWKYATKFIKSHGPCRIVNVCKGHLFGWPATKTKDTYNTTCFMTLLFRGVLWHSQTKHQISLLFWPLSCFLLPFIRFTFWKCAKSLEWATNEYPVKQHASFSEFWQAKYENLFNLVTQLRHVSRACALHLLTFSFRINWKRSNKCKIIITINIIF